LYHKKCAIFNFVLLIENRFDKQTTSNASIVTLFIKTILFIEVTAPYVNNCINIYVSTLKTFWILKFVIPRWWNREGDIVLAMPVRLSEQTSKGPYEFCFRTISLQLLVGFQRHFVGTINTIGDAHIITLFGSDPLTQRYGPWYFCCMHIVQHHFSVTTGWNSTKLYGNLQYHVVTLYQSDPATQSYGFDKFCSMHTEQLSFPCYFCAILTGFPRNIIETINS
jgi:hypothetical protein